MALGTMTKVTAYNSGNKRIRVWDIQLTSGANYVTGGTTITAASVGLRKIEAINGSIAVHSTPTVTRYVYWVLGDGATTTKMFVAATTSEVAANTDVSPYTVRVMFIGY